MKATITYLLFFISILAVGCEKIGRDFNLESIVSTKWTLSSVIDNETKEVEEFPGQLNQFGIYFKRLGIIELPGLCNYSFGAYHLYENDSINIHKVGQGTKMYCLPKLAMDWENLFVRNLREAKSYSIIRNQLIIQYHAIL